ncbi:carbohydrate ABC transporter permease [Cohnella sp. GCM10027633]|uniref:carbohydrate ABC transporter permease n=1 Tax=unclassified Cohnella TaxID=2636738 RepID=UPI0036258A1D
MATSRTIAWFFVPGTLLYLVVFVFPTLNGLRYSFTDWNGMSETFRYVGLDNFKNVAENLIFHKAFFNNLKFMAAVVIVQSVLSLLVALLLSANSRKNVALRGLFFFPAIISSVAIAFIGAFVYDPTLGLLNNLLTSIGLDSLAGNWLGDPDKAIYSVAAVQIWSHLGQMALLYIAGIQGIPADLYESATLDGGNRWQLFRWITWPLLAPTATIAVALTTIGSFKAFDLIFVMTKGGPSYSTEILSTYIYTAAFQNYRFGEASAASVYFMAIIALITFIQFKSLRANRITQ